MDMNLGQFDYLALHQKDATILTDGSNAIYNWKWKVPTSLNRRKAPYWFLSVVSAYCDDSSGSEAGNPHFLRCKIPAENYFTYETSSPYINFPIVAQLIRDSSTGHWYSISQDNVVLQVPSNLQLLEFDIIDGTGNVIAINNSTIESLNIICKITYPARQEVTENINQTFVQSVNPKMTAFSSTR
jgi:hypothetical protein